VAATFQSKPGAVLSANYAAPNSVVSPSLGRDLSGIFDSGRSNAVLTYNNTFVPDGPWLQPLAVLTPRLIKFTAAFDW